MLGALTALGSRWVWIGLFAAALSAGVMFGLHEYNVALETAATAKAALVAANSQTAEANIRLKEASDVNKKQSAQYKAQIAMVEKQRTEAQVRSAELSTLLANLRANGHGIDLLNDKLRAALERIQGRKFTDSERKAAAAPTHYAIVGVSPYDIQAAIDDLNQCADFITAAESPGAK